MNEQQPQVNLTRVALVAVVCFAVYNWQANRDNNPQPGPTPAGVNHVAAQTYLQLVQNQAAAYKVAIDEIDQYETEQEFNARLAGLSRSATAKSYAAIDKHLSESFTKNGVSTWSKDNAREVYGDILKSLVDLSERFDKAGLKVNQN